MRVCLRERELAFVSTISNVQHVRDVTLSELAIETFYPANAETALRLMEDVVG